MRIYRAKDYYDMSRKAANIISAQVIMKPDCVLGLATGSTPVGTYAQLVEWYKKGDLDFSEVKTVNLDEYKGLDQSNDQSYFYFMAEHLFDKVNIDFQNVNIPNGMETDADKECARYEAKIKALGGADQRQRRLISHQCHIVVKLQYRSRYARYDRSEEGFINCLCFVLSACQQQNFLG